MRLVLVVVAVLLTENLALPVGKEGQREDVITRCLVEVLSKALSKPDSQLDQECKDILQTGIKHTPLNKKSAEGIILHEEVVRGQPEGTEAKTSDVKDIEALLQSVAEKKDPPENKQGEESWNLGGKTEKGYENEVEEAREKRSNWRPGRYHQKHHKRGEEEEVDNERSQESWGLFDKKSVEEEEDEEQRDGTEREKRKWRPGRHYQKQHKRGEDDDYERSQESWGAFEKRSEEEEEEGEKEDGGEREKRKWRIGRHHQKPHKRDEESLGEEREEPEEERSQESWDLDKRYVNEEEEERSKRIWKPTRPYHHKKKIHKRGDEPSEVGEDEERSQESWGLDDDERDKRNWKPGRYHQRRHKRDEELSEEGREDPDEERSQEYWDFDTGRYKRNWRPGRHHQRRHKRDEELLEEAAEDPYDRSQEYWDFDSGIYKRDWRPGRYHQRRHKRDEELAEEKREEEYGDRSQEYWDFDKRHDKEDGEVEKRIWKPTHRYHHKKKLHRRDGESSENDDVSEEYEGTSKDREEAERYLEEKRNPWIYRGFYHPAWYKREPNEHAANSEKMDELAKMVSYKINQLANHSNQEVVKRSTHPRVLTPQEDKEMENLAAMDTELQKIATKLHDNSA
ncbi:secretogranin-1 [Cynoglossus semilaevis]|uniref:secretogranin-1 n=1 Tax=Cynoglossus semilaevis TaxID=244447 RepID=UPI000496495A|nr:secretogranin-1 [Cynoglossus semilaevis]